MEEKSTGQAAGELYCEARLLYGKQKRGAHIYEVSIIAAV